MDIRCQNCGERLALPSRKTSDATVEVTCHSCGVSMAVHLTHPVKAPSKSVVTDEERPSGQTWRRVFEPVPRMVMYLAGCVLAMMLLSPFWIPFVMERFGRNPIILSEDTAGMDLPSKGQTNAANPIMSAPEKNATTLDQYHNVRLEAARDDVEHLFNLRLQNTRGMEPEIYVASRSGDLERLTAYFYGGLLKEAFLVGREQRVTPDFIQKDLIEQFGAPSEQTELTGAISSVSASGLNTPALAGRDSGDELARKLAAFPFHRNMVWTDTQYRVEATIHYQSAETAENRSILALRLIAATWLKGRQAVSVSIPLQFQR